MVKLVGVAKVIVIEYWSRMGRSIGAEWGGGMEEGGEEVWECTHYGRHADMCLYWKCPVRCVSITG